MNGQASPGPAAVVRCVYVISQQYVATICRNKHKHRSNHRKGIFFRFSVVFCDRPSPQLRKTSILRKSRVFIVFDHQRGSRGSYHRVTYNYVPGWVDTMDDIRRDCGISHHRSKQEIERQRILEKVRHYLKIEKSDKFDLSVDFEQLKIEIM